jgi:hypothetical protein
MGQPRGWDAPHPIDRYWRAALVVFFNYGVDTGTVWDEHVPESSVEILGHSVGGITYRHYAHRAPLAFRAIMTLPQPNGFSAILRAGDSECPCCRRRFADAG